MATSLGAIGITAHRRHDPLRVPRRRRVGLRGADRAARRASAPSPARRSSSGCASAGSRSRSPALLVVVGVRAARDVTTVLLALVLGFARRRARPASSASAAGSSSCRRCLALGLSQLHAEATSLAAILPDRRRGVWRQQRYGNVRWRAAARHRRRVDRAASRRACRSRLASRDDAAPPVRRARVRSSRPISRGGGGTARRYFRRGGPRRHLDPARRRADRLDRHRDPAREPRHRRARRDAAPAARLPDVRLHPRRARCSASCSSTTTCRPTTAPRRWVDALLRDPAHHDALTREVRARRRGDRRRSEVRRRGAARPRRRRPRRASASSRASSSAVG